MLQLDKSTVYFRNDFVPFAEAHVSIANTGFLYGLGVFTGMRAHWNAQKEQLYLFRVNDHFDRLKASCKLCLFNGFIDQYDLSRYREILVNLLKQNDVKYDVYIRVSVFVDETSIGPAFGKYKDSLAIFLYPLGDYVPTQGMKCCVSSWRRVDDNAIPARAKIVGAYANTAFAKSEAVAKGFDEAIVLDNEGHAVEGSAENLFVVRQGTIITPPASANILEGVTRRTVLQIASDEGISVVERNIDRTELYLADEVFLSGTGAKVSAVASIDGYVIGSGGMGEITSKIQKIYQRAAIGDDNRYISWLTEVY